MRIERGRQTTQKPRAGYPRISGVKSWQAQWNTTQENCLRNKPTAICLAAWMSLFHLDFFIIPSITCAFTLLLFLYLSVSQLFLLLFCNLKKGLIKHLLHRLEQVAEVTMSGVTDKLREIFFSGTSLCPTLPKVMSALPAESLCHF